MLRLGHIARLAFQHSPEKEQRLLSYQNSSKTSRYEQENQIGQSGPDTEKQASKHIEKIRKNTRDRMAFLKDLAILEQSEQEEDNAVLETFFHEHQDFLGKYFKENLGKELTPEYQTAQTVWHLLKEFSGEMREISQRSLEALGPSYRTFLTDEEYVKKFMGVRLKLSPEQKISPKQIEEFRRMQYVPSAFFDKEKGVVYFNMSHEDFNFEKKLKTLREIRPNITEEQVLEIVERNRERAILHELGHYCLERKDRDGTRCSQLKDHLKNALRVKKLVENPEWKALQEAVDDAFDGKFGEQKEEKYLHEAIAIWTAAKRKPAQKDGKERRVVQAFESLLDRAKGNPRVREIVDEVDSDVTQLVEGDGHRESSYHFARRKMDDATAERTQNLTFKKEYEDRDIDAFTNAPENDDIKEEMAGDMEKTSKKLATADDIYTAIDAIKKAVAELRENKELYLKPIPKGERSAEEAAFEALLGKFDDDLMDVHSMEKDVMLLDGWETPGAVSIDEKNTLAQKWQFADIGLYDSGMNVSSINVLDAKNRAKRNEIFANLAAATAAHFEPITKLAKIVGESVEKKKDNDEKTDTPEGKNNVLTWMTETFGQRNGITWLSYYDLVKIYNIYKDAILEKYHAGQKIRTYDAAMNWNIWDPLQPDLKKQSKSANDEETEKFKEYLKKDGFTYDELFSPGGALDQNRHNVNRAKAVIDYAAEHAWLYKLDRFHGDNVYGVNYEGLWGARTFEELVDLNAESQNKEKSKGKTKVDTLPDIPLLVEDIEHELKKKNIWMVLGIVERLQEKAKYAESNTWALVTILRMIRSDRSLCDIMDKGFLDQIGGIGIGQSAWSLTTFKIQRHDLMPWIKKGATEEAMIGLKNGNAFIGRVFLEIEHLLSDHPDREDRTGDNGFDRKVARVFAGQTVTGKDGKAVSIFQDNEVFNAYREFWKKNPTSTEPGKTDDDFFNPANGGSDILLLPKTSVQAILVRTSQGQWTHQTKAPNFMAQVFMRDIDLGKNNVNAQRVYRREMKEKLSYFLKEAITQTATREKFGTDTTPTGGIPAIDDKNMLKELWQRDMISKEHFKQLVLGIKEGSAIPQSFKHIRKASQDGLSEQEIDNLIEAAKHAAD